MTWLDKHTFPRLARSTLNELQQNQHEKASLVCVRVQSPSGLALVPCALSMVDLSDQLRCWITHIQKNVFFFFFFGTLCSYDPLWRGFFAWRQKTASVASLPRPCLIIIIGSSRRLGAFAEIYQVSWFVASVLHKMSPCLDNERFFVLLIIFILWAPVNER